MPAGLKREKGIGPAFRDAEFIARLDHTIRHRLHGIAAGEIVPGYVTARLDLLRGEAKLIPCCRVRMVGVDIDQSNVRSGNSPRRSVERPRWISIDPFSISAEYRC